MKILKTSLFLAVSFSFSLWAQETVTVIPQPMPGGIKANANVPTAGYGDSTVQTQLRVDIKESDQAVRFVRSNTDPMVITKIYQIKNTNPYAVRGYLRDVVNGTKILGNPVQVDAVKFNDGRGVILVSAEEYRFQDNGTGESIDEIVAKLDQQGLGYSSGRPGFIYFPKVNSAANLKEMVSNVGAAGNGVEFNGGTDTLVVDGGLNALFVAAAPWSLESIKKHLEEYDKSMPEISITYQLLEVNTENDDKLGIDFQSWKNNNGADFFSVGGRYRNNWANTFAGNINGSHHSRTDFFNFNPKWNTRYFDFLASTGRAKVVTQGVLVAKNRRQSHISVGSGLFYFEQAPLDPTTVNDKIIPGHDVLPPEADPELLHGNAQNTEVKDGFKFELDVTPVVTGNASILPIKVSGTSLLGWNSDGSPRLNKSEFSTEVQVGNEGKDFVIGGIDRTNVIRSVSGIPLLKDIPFLGWLFSTETETTRHSELILIAHADISGVFETAPDTVRDDIAGVNETLAASKENPIYNLGFEQLGLDTATIE